MNRQHLIAQLARPITYDVAVIGGGATGLGVALDAAARGFSVVLVEAHDFAKGTSSRATKLVHGGVRYLAQGNIALVREALARAHHAAAQRAAPGAAAAVRDAVLPLWETPFYGVGLKMYDALAGKAGPGRHRIPQPRRDAGLPADGARRGPERRRQVLGRPVRRRPAGAGAGPHGRRRAARWWSTTAPPPGCARARQGDAGCSCQDRETGVSHECKARCVINATGVWVDEFRQQDGEAIGRPAGRWWRPARACTWWSTASSCPATTR